MTVLDARPDHSMLAFVNVAIGQLQRRLGLTDAEFFCECGSTLCHERIRLSRADYARIRQAGPVTVEAHAPSSSVPVRRPVDAAPAPEAAATPVAAETATVPVVGAAFGMSGVELLQELGEPHGISG